MGSVIAYKKNGVSYSIEYTTSQLSQIISQEEIFPPGQERTHSGPAASDSSPHSLRHWVML